MDVKEKVFEAELVLLALWESRCRGQGEKKEDRQVMLQRMPYLSRPIERISLPTFVGLGFPR